MEKKKSDSQAPDMSACRGCRHFFEAADPDCYRQSIPACEYILDTGRRRPCPAERFFPGAEGEELLLQGVVDCCLIEPDGAVIVDYKTDRIAPEAAPERAKRYAAQLETYAWAVLRITGLAVKAKIVYFLQPGEAVEL